MKWVGFWLRCLTLSSVIALAFVWWYSIALNVVYRGHFWLSLRELNEAVAVGEGVLFLITAAYSIYWLARLLKEATAGG